MQEMEPFTHCWLSRLDSRDTVNIVTREDENHAGLVDQFARLFLASNSILTQKLKSSKANTIVLSWFLITNGNFVSTIEGISRMETWC